MRRSGSFVQRIRRQLGLGVEQLNADDPALIVIIENHVRRDFGAFQHLGRPEPDIGGIVLGPVFEGSGSCWPSRIAIEEDGYDTDFTRRFMAGDPGMR